MSNWVDCGCERIDRVSGNGCLQCNPEKAYDIAKRLWNEMKERENGASTLEEEPTQSS